MQTAILLIAALSLIQGQQPRVQLGQKAPEFSLRDIEGKEVAFSKISKDKITVVDFWSAKCPYSQSWEKRLTAIYEEYKKKGVEFAVVDSNSTEPVAEIREYLAKSKVPYTIYLDPRSELADLFGAKATPHVFVFDKKGSLAYVGAIDDDSKGEKKTEERKNYLREALDALLGDKEPPLRETKPVGCSIKKPKA